MGDRVDLIFSLFLGWPFKTILWILPLIIVIYVAYKESYKKSIIILLSMIVSASFSWIHQWDFILFLEQISVFLIAGIIIIFDLKHQKTEEIQKDDTQEKDR